MLILDRLIEFACIITVVFLFAMLWWLLAKLYNLPPLPPPPPQPIAKIVALQDMRKVVNE